MLATAAVASSIVPAGCPTPGTEPVGPPDTPTPSAAQRSIVPVPTSLQVIPGQPPLVHYGTGENPQLGVDCGVRAARFGERWWVARSLVGARPGMDGTSQYATGSMTLVSPELARFAWSGGSADFVPADVDPPLCA